MKLVALYSILLAGSAGLFAQDQAPPPPPSGQALNPQQLDDLVAPIALYPDPLLSQVLVASTYPLEIVQALQWTQRNPGLNGPDLTAAAAQQNWDPSIQALVVFPDVLRRLNDDINWTTDLGVAFVNQQQDVMDAVQRMRQQAEQAGKLSSTPQQTVSTDYDDGSPYVSIVPAAPDVIYVPVYDPYWIWGPPVFYPSYARWYYPPRTVIYSGVGFGFGGGIHLGLYFGSGWGGWGAWGWHPGWGSRSVIVNNRFITRYNFNPTRVVNVRGKTVWAHEAGRPVASPRPAFDNRVRDNVRPGFDTRNHAAPNFESRRQDNPRPSFERTAPANAVQNRPAPQSRPAAPQPQFRAPENRPAPQPRAERAPSNSGGGHSRPASEGRSNEGRSRH